MIEMPLRARFWAGPLAVALALVTLLAGAPASADSAQAGDALQRAKNHYMAGNALFKLGNYTDAVREFAAGYSLVPKPYFLYNLGQCHRKLGDLRKAREMYARFVEQIPDSDPDREQAKKIVAELDEQIAKLPPEPVRKDPEPQPTVKAQPDPQLTSTTSSVTQPPPAKPFIKRHWWIIPVSIVVVGVGVGVGVYFGTKPPAQVGCNDAGVIGCVSAK